MEALTKMRALLSRSTLSRVEMLELVTQADKEAHDASVRLSNLDKQYQKAEQTHKEKFESLQTEFEDYRSKPGLLLEPSTLLEEQLTDEIKIRFEGVQKGTHNMDEVLHNFKLLS